MSCPGTFLLWRSAAARQNASFFLTEKHGPDVLEEKLANDFQPLWINNAGLDGHSTFGHAVLIEDYISRLKPKLVSFLVGVNDVGRRDLGEFELQHVRNWIDANSV
jgi:hypothetical protein